MNLQMKVELPQRASQWVGVAGDVGDVDACSSGDDDLRTVTILRTPPNVHAAEQHLEGPAGP